VSSYGTGDHASQVTPQSCVGVMYTGEHEVSATAGAPEIKTQTFGHLYIGADGPHPVQQTAAVFATAEAARAFLIPLRRSGIPAHAVTFTRVWAARTAPHTPWVR
jgi:PknH-like extracellular domain